MLELDVTVPEQVDAVAGELRVAVGRPSTACSTPIGFAPPACLGGGFLDAGWDDVKVALEISAYSLKVLAVGLRPLLQAAGGGSVVGLDFDATVAWPGYDWMGVAKAALESTARYLARDLGPDGIRVNLVAAGPIKTMAAKSIPGFSPLRGRVGRTGSPRLERHRSGAGGPGLRRPAVGLVPGDHRRDGPRRRRLPRHRRVNGPSRTRTGPARRRGGWS